jgi:hypothetical protein
MDRQFSEGNVQRILGIALLMGVASATLPAAGIFGQFTLDGTVTVTASGLIEWTSNSSPTPNSEATISSISNLTGTFLANNMGGQTVTINTLTDGPDPMTQQPVGEPFTEYNFIDFAAADGLPNLNATDIATGSGGTSGCSTDPATATAPQNCTLNGTTFPPAPGNGNSPFTFNNYTYTDSMNNTLCCTSTATWNISGVTSDGLSTWFGQFTATFNTSYQQQLDNFINTGQVSDAYSGVMTVTVQGIQSVPEPTSWIMMAGGIALLGLGSFRRKRRA